MRKSDLMRLNAHALRERVEELGLKQWWLAREIGVASRTVNRWMTGEVKRIAQHNAQRLADQLDCPIDTITVSDSTDVLATRREQHEAAKLLQEHDLIQLLSPSDNWKLAESLIRATMEPNLPLHQLGQLYNLLSIAAWRQREYDEGIAHARRALDIAERTERKGIRYKAQCNIATIDSLRGNAADARSIWEECVGDPDGFDDDADHAAALSNLATLYREYAMFDQSSRVQARAIEQYETLDRPFNCAIAWITETLLRIELGDRDGAADALSRVEEFSRASGFDKGLAQALCYRADIDLLCGGIGRASDHIEAGLSALRSFEIYDISCHEIEARVLRRTGDKDRARTAIDRAIEKAVSIPVPFYEAMFLQERARLHRASGDDREEERDRTVANDIFQHLGFTARVRQEPVVEYGSMLSS